MKERMHLRLHTVDILSTDEGRIKVPEYDSMEFINTIRGVEEGLGGLSGRHLFNIALVVLVHLHPQ